MDRFERFAAFIQDKSGIVVKLDRIASIENRLRPIFEAEKDMDFNGLLSYVVLNPRSPLTAKVIDAMTINESYFFRDKHPFTLFEELMVPTLMESSSRKMTRTIKTWCAAASTGQEPYSLAMTWLAMAHKVASWRLSIVGTDINEQVLEKARQGVYNQFEAQRGLPIQTLVKHFTQVGDHWQINENLRNMVQFKPFNLMSPTLSMGKFDLIYCRNVLIYFDKETKAQILEQMFKQLAPDGFLILGSSETLFGITDCFKIWDRKPGVYRRADFGAEKAPTQPAMAKTGLAALSTRPRAMTG